MAINTQKFLPQSKSEIVKSKDNFILPYKNIIKRPSSEKNNKTNIATDSAVIKRDDGFSENLEYIKNKLIDVDKLLKTAFLSKKKSSESLNKEKETEEFKKREEKLEAKPPKGLSLPSVVGEVTGNIFDRIKRFLLFTALGWLVPKLIEFLPTLINILKVIGSVYKFFEDIFGKLLDAFTGFLEFGFKVQDQIKDAIKAIGGEGAAKAFDDFNGVLTTLVNTILISGMVFSSGIGSILGDLLRNKDCCCPDPSDLLDELPETPRTNRLGLSSTRNVQKALSSNILFETLRSGRNFTNINRLTGIAGAGVTNFGKSAQQLVVGSASGRVGVKDVLSILNKTGNGASNFLKKAVLSGWITPEQAVNIASKGKGFGSQIARTSLSAGKNVFQSVGGQALGFAKNLPQLAVEKAKQAKDLVFNAGKSLFEKVGSSFNNIDKWGKSLSGKIAGLVEISKNPSLLLEKVKNVILGNIKPKIEQNPLVKSILNIAKNPKDAVKSVGSTIKTALANKEIRSVADYLKKVQSTTKGIGPIDKVIASLSALLDYGYLGAPFINALFAATGGLLGYTAGFAIGAPFGGVPGFISGAAGGIAGDFIGKQLANLLGKTGLAKIEDPIMKDGRMLVAPSQDSLKDPESKDSQKTQETDKDGKTQKTEFGGLILPEKKEEEKKILSDFSSITRGGKEIGGKLTRGGKEIGGNIGRTLKVAKRRPEKPIIKKLNPPMVGKDVSGGENSIVNLYGGSKTDDGKKNGFLTLMKSFNILDDMPFGIGNILQSTIGIILGQKSQENVSEGLSQSIAYLINSAISGLPPQDFIGPILKFSDGGNISQMNESQNYFSNIKESISYITSEEIQKYIKSPINNKFTQMLSVIAEQSLKGDRISASSTANTGTSGGSDTPSTDSSANSANSAESSQQSTTGSGGSMGSGGVVQWLHGNPNRPGYDRAGHGLESNAHDHFGFASRDLAVKGFNALKSSGYSPYEFEGFTSVGSHSATGGHFGPVGGSPTYDDKSDGTAFDVPWSRPPYAGVGQIGQKDYEASDNAAKIVGALTGSAGKFHGGFITKGGLEKVHIKEYIVDADSVNLLGREFFEIINRIENKNQLESKVPLLVSSLKTVSDSFKKPRYEEGKITTPLSPDAVSKTAKLMIKESSYNKSHTKKQSSINTLPNLKFGSLMENDSSFKINGSNFSTNLNNNASSFNDKNSDSNIKSTSNPVKSKETLIPEIPGLSKELVMWAKSNRSMIEKVGTKEQKEILHKIDNFEKNAIIKPASISISEISKNNLSIPKMISGGQISPNQNTQAPQINKFASYDDPTNGNTMIYIQPYIIENAPNYNTGKSSPLPYFEGATYVGNEKIASLLRS